MDMKGLIERIERRLEALDLKPAEASRRATGNPDTIRNWQRAVEKGKGQASMSTLEKVAPVLGTNVTWLAEGIGPEAGEAVSPVIQYVPLVSWISAGQLAAQDGIVRLEEFRRVPMSDLPKGMWIALRVEGDSMNKISPPESIIFVNLDERELVPNSPYIIADETGNATYKRYRPNDDPPFQPASYHDVEPPKLVGGIKVIGRVRRSMVDP